MSSVKRDNNNVVVIASNFILDIEGTTSSISFVKDVLFPHVRKNLEEYINKNWDSAEFQEILEALKTQSKEDEEKQVEGVITIPGSGDKDALMKTVIDNVTWQMDNDRKTKSLKDLQGLIMEEGYKQGDIKGHVYDDVEPSLKSWTEQDKSVYIYSSGSVHAQKLLFGHSVKGNLLPLIKGHFDTSVGMKGEMTSYKKIVDVISSSPAEVVFLTDVPKEAKAAKEAGLSAILVSREGNSPFTNDDAIAFPVISSFSEIELELTCKKRKICIEDVNNKVVEKCSVSVEGEINPIDPKLTTNDVEMMEVDENPEAETTKEDKSECSNGASLGQEKIKETNSDDNSKLEENKEVNTADSEVELESACDKKVELVSKAKSESVAAMKDEAADESIKSANRELLNGNKEETDLKLNGETSETIKTSNHVSETKESKQVSVADIESEERIEEIVEKDSEETVKDNDVSKESTVADVNKNTAENNITVLKQDEPSNGDIQEQKVETKENSKDTSTSIEDSLKLNASSGNKSLDKTGATETEVDESNNIISKNSSEKMEILKTPPDSTDADNKCENLPELKEEKSPNKPEILAEKSSDECNNTKDIQETLKDASVLKETDSDSKLHSETESCQPKDPKLPEIVVSEQIKDSLSETSSMKRCCVTETMKVPETELSVDVPSQDTLVTKFVPQIEPHSEKLIETETKQTDIAQKQDDLACVYKSKEGETQIESQSKELTETNSETKQAVSGDEKKNPPKECKMKEVEEKSHPQAKSCPKELVEVETEVKQTDLTPKKDSPAEECKGKKETSNLEIESQSEELMEIDSETKQTDLVQKDENQPEECKAKKEESILEIEPQSGELMETDSEIKPSYLVQEKDNAPVEVKEEAFSENQPEECKTKKEESNLGIESQSGELMMETDSEIGQADLTQKKDSSPEQCKAEEKASILGIESKTEEVMETESEIKPSDQVQKENSAPEECIEPSPQVESHYKELPKTESEMKQTESVELPQKKESPHEECKGKEVEEITDVPSKGDSNDKPTKIVCDSKENKTETSDSSSKVDVNGLTQEKSEVDLSNTETNVPSVLKTETNEEDKTLSEIKNKNEPTNHSEVSQNGMLSNGDAGKSLNGSSSPSPDKELSNENDVTQTTSCEGKKCDTPENSVMETVVEA